MRKKMIAFIIIVAHGQPNWIQFGSVSEDCFLHQMTFVQ